MLPNGQFVGGGCLFSLGSPGLGVVVFAPDATVLRVLSTCSSIQSGSLGVATTVDGTIYFGRSREIVPFEEYRYELVRIPPGGAPPTASSFTRRRLEIHSRSSPSSILWSARMARSCSSGRAIPTTPACSP